MKLSFLLTGAIVILGTLPLAGAFAVSPITKGEPVPLRQLRSLGDVIADAPNRKVHIIYVHGMRAEGRGASDGFRQGLVKFAKAREATPRETKVLKLLPWPQTAAVAGQTIWRSEEDWNAGQPFIDRYVLQTDANVTVTIDEVNWWPLLFPLKCEMLVAPKALVAGLDQRHLDLCYRNDAPYHRWIDESEYKRVKAARPALGGAASANRYLKQQILDWGMSDAVIATGPMRAYINAAMDAAFEGAAAAGETGEYVVISESLGSFAILDAYAAAKPNVRDVLNETHYLYFLANQFALLELARVQGVPQAAHVERASNSTNRSDISAAPLSAASPLSAMEDWAKASGTADLSDQGRVKQVVAFSDPSDALTFRVPNFGSAAVSNVYVRNAWSFVGLFANPVRAHSGHLRNSAVWRAMRRRGAEGRAAHRKPDQ